MNRKPNTENRTPKLILALDVATRQQTMHWVKLLYPKVKIFKVGLQLYTACGPKIIQDIRKIGAEVFLDLKFNDIPNTVACAVRSAARLKVKMLTLHVSGGQEMLKAAAGSVKKESRRLKIKPPLLIGVTVLTSKETKADEVLKLAKLGLDCGLDGVVCSAQEASLLRKNLGDKFIIVTTGIRPKIGDVHDQKRIATAGAAIKAGSNFLVVGRPILEAKDPLLALNDILRD